MKKLSFIILLSFLSLLNAKPSNLFDYSNMREFKSKKIDGVVLLVDPRFEEHYVDNFAVPFIHKMMLYAKRKMPPHIFEQVKEKNLKIIIVKNKSGRVLGAEYVRTGQSKWDKRVNEKFDRSIVLLDINMFMLAKDYAYTTFIHELVHFYHLEVKKTMNKEIEEAYRNAIKSDKFKTSYARKNKYEYFAEISSAYFSDFGVKLQFPFDASDLKKYDPIGFNLCQKFWGAVQIKPKPSVMSRPNPFVKRPSKPEPEPVIVYKPDYDDDPVALAKFLSINRVISLARLDEYTNKPRESYWKYEDAEFLLEEFDKKYPDWRRGLIKRELNKIKIILKNGKNQF